jgi:hypothetical protein
MPVPSRHVELALYANDTAIIAKSRSPALLVTYLDAYFIDLERCLRAWRIAINVSKSNAMFVTQAGWRSSKTRPVQFLGQPIQWVDIVRYLGVIFDRRMTWSPRPRRKLHNYLVCFALSFTGEAVCPSGTEFC